MKRAAVVIGVAKTGNFTPLPGAVAGANRVNTWFLGEGFDVSLITDEREPVTMDRVGSAIRQYVRDAGYEQLVVYFAGHGFLRHYSEYWLFSNAPTVTWEAVNVAASIELARRCGIPNVTFLSDACRSTVQSLTAQSVDGAAIFPNDDDSGIDVTVDSLFATRRGEEALEVKLTDNRFDGVFTDVLLKTFNSPPPQLVLRSQFETTVVDVIPNRRLRLHLPEAVGAQLRSLNILQRQMPELRVESDEPVHLGRANVSELQFSGGQFHYRSYRTDALLPSPDPDFLPVPPTVAPTEDFARMRIEIDWKDAPPHELLALAAASGFAKEVADGIAVRGRPSFETRTGFTVDRVDIAEAVGVRCKVEQAGDRDLRIHPTPGTFGSVLIRFAGGGGTVLAAPEGYIGTVQVQEGRVHAVNYVPSQNDWRWSGTDHVATLRAVAAAAMRRGDFALDKDGARRFGDRVRQAKAIDPTLGLYASYAYANAGEAAEVRSVEEYMRNDIQGAFFDVLMLARERWVDPSDDRQLAPFVPMLSQAWPLLDTMKVRLPKAVTEVQRHVLGALWTTFDEYGIRHLIEAASKGELG